MSSRILERLQKSWAEQYKKNPRTDWEKLPLGDLTEFIEESSVRKGIVETVLDIGCGRGLRDIILATRFFDRSEVKYFGIDIAEPAIHDARECLNRLMEGQSCEQLKPYLPNTISKPQCNIKFEVANILQPFPWSDPKSFDLVIDWMCFHELQPMFHKEYLEKLKVITNIYYVLCVFSREHSTLRHLQPVVKDIEKHQFSEDEITRLFGEFSIVYVHQYEENSQPFELHTDGPVAAKRAYLMVKKISN